MRFTEKSITLETDNLFHFIRGLVVLILFAPFRLISEISSRIVFLRKETVCKILLISFGFGVVTSIIFLLCSLYRGEPVTQNAIFVFSCIGDILLFLIYYVYKVYGFVIYDSLDIVFPSCNDDNVDADSLKDSSDQSNGESESYKESQCPLGSDKHEGYKEAHGVSVEPLHVENTDFDIFNENSKDIEEQSISADESSDNAVHINPISIDSQEIRDFQNRFSTLITDLQQNNVVTQQLYSESQIIEMEEQMDACTDPSKYIDENLIAMFADSAAKDDVSFIDGLDLSVIPNDFTMLA